MDLALKPKGAPSGIPRPVQPGPRSGSSDRRDFVKSAVASGLAVAPSRPATAPPAGPRPTMPQPMDLAKKTIIMSTPHLVSTGVDSPSAMIPGSAVPKIIKSSPGKSTLVPLVLTPGSQIPVSAGRAVQAHIIHPVAGGVRSISPAVSISTAGLPGGAIITPGTHISAVPVSQTRPVQITKNSGGTVAGLAIPKSSLSGPRIITPSSASGMSSGNHTSASVGVLTRPTLVASVGSDVTTRLTLGPGGFMPAQAMSGMHPARDPQNMASPRPTKTVYISAAHGTSTVLPVSKVGISAASVTVTSGRSIVRTANQTVTLLTTVSDRNSGSTTLRPNGPLGFAVLPDGRTQTVRVVTGGATGTAMPAHVGSGNQLTLTAGANRIAVASVTGLRTVSAVGDSRIPSVSTPSSISTQTHAAPQQPTSFTTVNLSPSASARLTHSPRPSILRKRDAESPGGSPAKRALLLTSAPPLSPVPMTSSSYVVPSNSSTMSPGPSTTNAVYENVTPPSSGRALSPVDGDSNSSSTLSATSSAGDVDEAQKDYFDEDRLEIDESRRSDDGDEEEDQDTEAPSFDSRLLDFIKKEPGGDSPSYEMPDGEMMFNRPALSAPMPDSPYSYHGSPSRHGSDSSAGPSGYYSPRKKPRKQHLQGIDFSDEDVNRGNESTAIAVDLRSEFSRQWHSEDEMLDPSEIKEEVEDDVFETYSGRQLRNKRIASSDDGSDVRPNKRGRSQISELNEETESASRPSILSTYRCWWNPSANHFVKRSEIRVKEEKKETIHDLCSQKLLERRAEGYGCVMIDRHLDDLETDEEVIQQSLLRFVARWDSGHHKKHGSNAAFIRELAMANYQRSLLILQQTRDARDNLIGIVNHRPAVIDLIRKNAVKPRTSGRKREK